jgi:hypothetical protein
MDGFSLNVKIGKRSNERIACYPLVQSNNCCLPKNMILSDDRNEKRDGKSFDAPVSQQNYISCFQGVIHEIDVL